MKKLVAPVAVVLAFMFGLPDLAASTPAPDGRAARVVDLHPCPRIDGAVCGSIVVPLDPRDVSLGTTEVGFIRYPRRRQELPSLGTIVAVEGGPGYSTIASRWWYRDLYKPLLDRRDLLLVDLRGTGRSDAIDCPQLQSYRGPWKRHVALCGRQLGPLSERYGSAFAAADLVDGPGRAGDRPDRPLRRLVRDVLRADVRRPVSGANANRHARRRLPDRQRRRVVARHEPRDRGGVPGDLRTRSRLRRDG